MSMNISGMFANARQTIRCQHPSLQAEPNGHVPLSGFGQFLPDHFTFEQLYENIAVNSEETDHVRVLVFVQCVQCPERILRQSGDSVYAKKLLSWLCTIIHPVGELLTFDEGFYDDKHREFLQLKILSRLSLLGILFLDTHVFEDDEEIEPSILLGIIAYTDTQDPWTTQATQHTAGLLLTRHQNQLLAHEFIIDHLLAGHIRPLFSGSGPSTVTPQGRRAMKPFLNPSTDQHSKTKSWKSQDVTAVTAFSWAILNMSEDLLHRHWHLCIPPLLKLLDDTSTPTRLRGLDILIILLSKAHAKDLQETGLVEVFEDAVMPTLHFLPSLTPTEESLKLLASAYTALLKLVDAGFAVTRDKRQRVNFLDRIMRQGVLQGFNQAGEDLAIAEFLFRKMALLVQNMGIHSIKHLKKMIPILSGWLTNPFVSSRPNLLREAVKTTQSVVTTCWPRMTESFHRIELIRAITICWILVDKEVLSAELKAIKEELRVSRLMIAKTVEGTLDSSQELRPLIGNSLWLEKFLSTD